MELKKINNGHNQKSLIVPKSAANWFISVAY